MNLDKTITWGEMARSLGVIVMLTGVGVLVAWMPHWMQVFFAIVGFAFCMAVARLVVLTLSDKRQAKAHKAKRAKPPEGVHGVYIPEERTVFDIEQEAKRLHRQAVNRAKEFNV